MKLLNHTDKNFLKTTTQYDYRKQKTWNAYRVSIMRSSKKEWSNKAWLDQKQTITINNDHNDHSLKEWTSDMQTNKLNTKYHLHVQHSTDTKTQGNCIKDIKSNKGIREMYLKKFITLTTSSKPQSMGTKEIYWI